MPASPGGFVAGLLAAGIVNFRFLDLKLAPFCRSHIQSLFAFSFWTFLSSGGYLVFSYADTIMIGYFMTDADIGIYRVALQLTSIATFTTVALHTTLYPKISYWGGKQNDLASVERALARAFTYSLLLAVPVVAGGWLLGERSSTSSTGRRSPPARGRLRYSCSSKWRASSCTSRRCA
ncbi:oligosaccharide flippase family protein [Methanoculleus chikugoensis]|uniref:oligosaccharide flippase family protein n=1 Tax=Methanoculleus chikugoensis TaxID=118126 RepID=UPI001FB2407F|nr:oligosaccharide flippase family protein [Methanoculleus chikugoensis]